MVTSRMNADLSAALKFRTSAARSHNSGLASGWRNARKKYLNVDYVRFLLFDVAALPIVAVLVIVAELILNVVVIWRVPYTEIDWIAYMQECEGFLNGTTNYALLKGDTGPLVYPAAFVYIYSALYFLTGHGHNIRLAQCLFAVVYLLQMGLVMRLYAKSRKVPPYVLAISAFTSYRVHSIYVLRLFNDPLAVLLLYAALNYFVDERWTWGSVCYSIGVGIKMNILLYAPALFLFYLVNLGYRRTALQLTICALIQLLLGAPFLLTHPVAYVRGAFNLGRIFDHQWTVNYRFLSRTIFEHSTFHLMLLAIHVLLLLLFARPTLKYFTNYVRLRALQKQLQPQIERKNREVAAAAAATTTTTTLKKKKTKKMPPDNEFTASEQTFLKAFEKSLQQTTAGRDATMTTYATATTPEPAPPVRSIHFEQCTQLALLPFFLCNFIGVACARSLHYQFYVWYFHSLPHLAWSTGFSLGLRFLLLGLIEFAWNTYPSTVLSSGLLHACHLTLLVGVGHSFFKTHGTSTRQHEDKERTE